MKKIYEQPYMKTTETLSMSRSSDQPPPAPEPAPNDSTDKPVAAAVEGPEPRAGRKRFGLLLRIGSMLEWLFGVASMIVILAVLATIPILQMLSLGYLLEVSGRVASSGKLRDGFIGIRTAARIGSIVLGAWILFLPLHFVSDLRYTARLIDPDSSTAHGWGTALTILTVLIVGHILWAWYRGGRFRHFLWPAPVRFIRRIFRRGMYLEARDSVWNFVVDLRLFYYFWLGLRGFAGALIWLVVPVSMLAIALRMPSGADVLTGLLGGVLLATVLLYLPFLQTHFAVENRFGALFELGAVRRQFRQAPIAFWFALLITLLFALPLYLLKIELTPREVAWLPSLVFVVFIFPARLLTGWAVGRARRREQPRHSFFRWAARFAALPVVGIYALIVFFTQYLSWYGAYSLYEQHAFLVPVPFLDM